MLTGYSPWQLLIWLAGVIAIWAVASIPGYWFLSAWLLLRNAISAVLGQMVSFLTDLRLTREARRAAVAVDIQSKLLVHEVDPSLLSAWINGLSTAHETIERGASELRHTREFAQGAFRKIEPLARRLQKLTLLSETVPEVVPPEQAILKAKRNRVAVINLLVAIVLLIPIAAVNAQLTALVLTGFLGRVQPILGVPVPVVLAAVLVFTEAGVGLLHSVEAESRFDSHRRLTIGAVLWSIAGLGVVGLETLLYSLVDPGQNNLELPVGGSAFALMGAVLGLTVFGLGRLAHSSAATIRRERTPAAVARQFVRLRQAADDWNNTAQRLGPSQQSATESLQRVAELCEGVSTAEHETAERVQSQLQHAIKHPPDWAQLVSRPLSESEFAELQSATYLWSAVAVISAGALIALSAAMVVRLADLSALLLGVALALASFAPGALAAVLQRQYPWRRLLIALGLWLIPLIGSLVVARMLRGSLTIHAVAFLLLATAEYISGLMIGRAALLLRLPLLWVIDVISYAACGLAIAVTWVVGFVTALIEYVARVIAWPCSLVVQAWRGRNSREAQHVASV